MGLHFLLIYFLQINKILNCKNFTQFYLDYWCMLLYINSTTSSTSCIVKNFVLIIVSILTTLAATASIQFIPCTAHCRLPLSNFALDKSVVVWETFKGWKQADKSFKIPFQWDAPIGVGQWFWVYSKWIKLNNYKIIIVLGNVYEMDECVELCIIKLMLNFMNWINWVDSEWVVDNDDDGSRFGDDDDEDACRVSEE